MGPSVGFVKLCLEELLEVSSGESEVIPSALSHAPFEVSKGRSKAPLAFVIEAWIDL